MEGKIISYFGKEKCDLMYAIAAVACATHRNVLVIDYSLLHDLYAVYAKNKREENEILDFGSMVVVKDRIVPESDMRNFDLTIIYNGMNLNQIVLQKADEYIVAPGDESQEVARAEKYIREMESSWETEFTLIQRDKVNRKQTLGTLANKLGIIPKRSYVLTFDSAEYGAYLALTINGNCGATGIANEIRSLATELICITLGDDPKRINKILKKL